MANATLRKTNTQDVFQINAPAVAGALTRSGGKASAALRGRIAKALQARGMYQLEFKRGASGKWYVRISSRTVNIAPVAEFNRSMERKYGNGVSPLSQLAQ